MELKTDCSAFECLLSGFTEPDKEKLIYFGKKFTQNEVVDEIYRVRNFLKTSGIGKGDVVSVMLPNIPAFAFAVYGASANGSITSLLAPDLQADRLKDLLVRTKSKAVFVWDYSYDSVKSVLNELSQTVVVCSMSDYAAEQYALSVGKFAVEIGDKITRYSDLPLAGEKTFEKHNGTTPEIYMNTGGTTSGVPKTVVYCARALNVGTAAAAHRMFVDCGGGFTPEDTGMAVLPLFHSGGFIFAFYILMPQIMLVMVPTQLIGCYLPQMREYEVTYIIGVPTIYKRVVALGNAAKEYFRSVKYSIVAADKTSKKLKDDYDALFSGQTMLFDCYGTTETDCVPAVGDKNAGYSQGRTVSSGKILIKDINSDKFLSKPYEKGECIIDSEYLMTEYLGEGDNSATFLFIDGKKYGRTGDVGYLDENGYFYFVDRLKRAEKIGGDNVFPSEIEELIKAIDGVADCVVARKRDASDKAYLSAYVLLIHNISSEELSDKITDIVTKGLDKISVPRSIITVDSIVKTSVGKNDFKYYEGLND
jgi:long-chain acyl-CoA synthetase